ncbi:MAG: CpaF family protein [Actinobacteria bacterium]|nr:CpaF family protein [Actinomycetota bacterium]
MNNGNIVPSGAKSAVREQLLGQLAGGIRTTDEEVFNRMVGDALIAQGFLPPKRVIESLANELRDEIFGFGPLEGLLRDPDISEIMVNGHSEIYVEKEGRIEKSTVTFEADSQLLETIRRIINPLNLRIDDMSPMVDARLPDGSRLNSIIPPLCLNGPSMTIRKFRTVPFSVTNLLDNETMTIEMASFLREAVQRRANMIVSGGTSSGKTTLLNVLSSFIPVRERLITIEDAAELKIRHPHVVSLESRPANIEGKGEVTVRGLVRNALRMRPDRIIVGEVRGAEALDMLQAMNTGHPGSLTTAHANSPTDLLNRLETMVMMSETNLDLNAVRRQIGSAIDLIIHMDRRPDGKRILSRICSLSCPDGCEYKMDNLLSTMNSSVKLEDWGPVVESCSECGGGT